MSFVPILDQLHNDIVARLEELVEPRSVLTPASLEPLIIEVVQGHPLALNLTEEERQMFVRRLLNRVLGFGPLQPLLNDPTITEIMVNGISSVYIERHGQLSRQEIIFTSEAEVLHIINRMVGAVGRRIDSSSPLVDARLPDGSRVNAIIAPLSRIGPVLTIRRFPDEAFSLEKLLTFGTMSETMMEFLRAAVRARQNIIISGATGSGKTSLLNALVGAVGESERLVTIEDTAEMRLGHPHLVQLEARLPNMEGRGEITIRTLLKNALRMRPDRIIIGEVRGSEALDMLQAMNTGHQGSLTTIHANAPEEALLRLETMALMADVDLPFCAIREQVRSAIHYVIQIERLPSGNRKIVAVSELVRLSSASGLSEGGYMLRTLFRYDKVRQSFVSAYVLPERLSFFEQAGVAVNQAWFLS